MDFQKPQAWHQIRLTTLHMYLGLKVEIPGPLTSNGKTLVFLIEFYAFLLQV